MKKKCCVEVVKRIWDMYGGPMFVIHYYGKCPQCGHFIEITQTPIKEANEILREFGLEEYDE